MVSRWPRDPPNDQGPMSTVHLRMPDISERGGSPWITHIHLCSCPKTWKIMGNTICQNVYISTFYQLKIIPKTQLIMYADNQDVTIHNGVPANNCNYT